MPSRQPVPVPVPPEALSSETHEVLETFKAPGGPDCMDLSADQRYIFVASRWAKKLTVIDIASRKVVRQVRVGKSPHGVWTLDHAPMMCLSTPTAPCFLASPSTSIIAPVCCAANAAVACS